MIKKYTKNLALILLVMAFLSEGKTQDLNLQKCIQPVPVTAKFGLDSFMVWCGSCVKGDNGKYYLFYSRWPKSSKHESWVTKSEVAVAVADSCTGPFHHVKVVLPMRDKRYWDADVTHNPTVQKFGKKYYLYYMGNYGNGEWWNHRNHQRIGVAVASNPLGPWKRCDKPLIDTSFHSFDHLMASNPAITKRLDGKYLMIYKGVGEGTMPFGGKVLHGAAIADRPEGPFKKMNQKIFVKDTVQFAAEDPYIWQQGNKYWAVVKDNKGYFTNAGVSLALFESKDGIDWKPAKNVLVTKTEIPWTTGLKQVKKLERPQLYIENGVPKVLFCAIYDGADNYNVAIPLKMEE